MTRTLPASTTPRTASQPGAFAPALPMRAAIIVAGGRGSRTGGRTKVLFEDSSGHTLVEAALEALRSVDVLDAHTVVVGGPELAPVLPTAALLTREEPAFSGPAAAIGAGLAALDERGLPFDEVFVLPADMPDPAQALHALQARHDAGDFHSSGDGTGSGTGDGSGGFHGTAELVLARSVDDDGQPRVEPLLALVNAHSLRTQVQGRALADLPVRALWRDLRSRTVDIPAAWAADVDTMDDAQKLGVHARSAHPDWREAGRIAHTAAAGGLTSASAVALAHAVGAVSAENLVVSHDVPHYASSAMDGFAISGPGPWRLERRDFDRSAVTHGSLEPGEAMPVVTGSPLPAGTSSVIRSEYAHVDGDRLSLATGAPAQELTADRHIRPSGREAAAGTVIARAGTVLSPAHVAFAAVAGCDEVSVRARPRVGFLFTGDEVVLHGQPEPGQVRDAFGPQLPAALESLGCEVVCVERTGDDPTEVAARLETLIARCDLVLSTGGTGHSRVDAVRSVVEDRCRDGGDATLLFSEIAMRPGHPAFAARFAHGAVHVALPGNPLAAMAALRVVAVPVIRGLTGQANEEDRLVELAHDVAPGGLERIVPARQGSSGQWSETAGTGPNMMRGLAHADGLIVVPQAGAHAGQFVPLLSLPW